MHLFRYVSLCVSVSVQSEAICPLELAPFLLTSSMGSQMRSSNELDLNPNRQGEGEPEMPTREIDGRNIDFDDQGFLRSSSCWTPVLAELIARDSGIAPLTQKHWTVLSFCREEAATIGKPPSLSRLADISGISTRELHELFPGDPGGLAAKIAGLPNSGLSL